MSVPSKFKRGDTVTCLPVSGTAFEGEFQGGRGHYTNTPALISNPSRIPAVSCVGVTTFQATVAALLGCGPPSGSYLVGIRRLEGKLLGVVYRLYRALKVHTDETL